MITADYFRSPFGSITEGYIHRSHPEVDCNGYCNQKSSLFELHVSCEEHPLSWIFKDNFQVTFYEIIEPAPEHECWDTGTLFSRSNTDTKDVDPVILRHQLIPTAWVYRPENNNLKEPKEHSFWTILVCTPSNHRKDLRKLVHDREDLLYSSHLQSSGKPVQVFYEQALLAILKVQLTRILEKWNELLAHLNALLAARGQATFMNPDSYVHLLYDESNFSRSKFYFWAIGCLSSFEENIVITARHPKSVRRKLVNEVCRKLELGQVSYGHTEHIKMLDAELEPLCKQLEDIGEQFGKRLETVRALRDGVSTIKSIFRTEY
ncbi:hypothetical protein HYALB_00008920 [Hymenoscyphus albidus]|uniref:Uncharacterized protein n=1 Tax=Hymenoscyphus albidus TaxID=595503 RepID=A0A9N9LUV7_9HELO|nr:hypothetical protein HYALB_00008920 [Hymenoscyphus albidus]